MSVSSDPIGRIELRVLDHGAELLFVLARAHWGQGLMTEAARAVLGWAMEQPGHPPRVGGR